MATYPTPHDRRPSLSQMRLSASRRPCPRKTLAADPVLRGAPAAKRRAAGRRPPPPRRLHRIPPNLPRTCPTLLHHIGDVARSRTNGVVATAAYKFRNAATRPSALANGGYDGSRRRQRRQQWRVAGAKGCL